MGINPESGGREEADLRPPRDEPVRIRRAGRKTPEQTPIETVNKDMNDFLPVLAALLGVLIGVQSRRLPKSAGVALALQAFPLTGYYFALFHCHT